MLTSNRRHAAYSPTPPPLRPRLLPPHRPIPRPTHPRRRRGDPPVCVTKSTTVPATQAKKGLIYTQNIPPAPRFCVTTPPAPALGMPAAHPRLPWAASPVHSNTPRLPSPSGALIAVPLSPRRFALIRFVSQNPHLSVQTKAKQGLIYTQDIPPALQLCVTTLPAPASGMPAAYSRLPWAASPFHSSTPQLPSPPPAFKIAVSLSPRRFA